MKKRRGFTLIELIVAMAIITIVVSMSANMLLNVTQSHEMISDTYDMNAQMRLASDFTNKTLRYSSAIFTIPEGRYFEANLTAGWDYFGLSENKKEIIKYTYEERTNASGVKELKHWKDVIVKAHEDIEYTVKFEKIATASDDRLVKFMILATNTKSGSSSVTISSEVRLLNALQVVDRGTSLTPAIAIAYRSEERPVDDIVGVVTMVMDVSGSMANDMSNASGTGAPLADQRITKVKNALTGYTKSDGTKVSGMINEFAKEENVEISLVPFSTTANRPDPLSGYSNENHPFFKPSIQSERNDLIDYVNSLSANGGTNTGDGMRRAYYGNQYFKTNVKTMTEYGTRFSTRDYMIILVDGVTTMATSVGGIGDNRYKTSDGYVSNTTFYYKPQWWENPGIIGLGSSKDPVTDRYVELIGSKIKSSGTTVFVIGFSEVESELASVEQIAKDAGAKAVNVYKFTDNLDLDGVFTEIRESIMKDLWHIRGPKL